MKFKCQCGTSIEISDDKGVKAVTCPTCGMATAPASGVVKVACRCGNTVEISDSDAGKSVACPACGELVAAPAAQPRGAIKFRCHCGKTVEVPQSRAGQMYVCPFCKLTMLIPFAHDNAPFREGAHRRKPAKHGGDFMTATPVWTNKWLDSAQWPPWVKPLVVGGLLMAIIVPLWVMMSGPSGSNRPSPTDNTSVIKPTTKGVNSSANPPAPQPAPAHPVPAPVPDTPPPPLPKVYGEQSFNVITGVSASGKHFDLDPQGYTPAPEDTRPAYWEGAVLVVATPEGVKLPVSQEGGKQIRLPFDFRQIIIVEKKDNRVTFRAATPHDRIRLRQAITILGKQYGAGDFAVPDDGKVEDAAPKGEAPGAAVPSGFNYG